MDGLLEALFALPDIGPGETPSRRGLVAGLAGLVLIPALWLWSTLHWRIWDRPGLCALTILAAGGVAFAIARRLRISTGDAAWLSVVCVTIVVALALCALTVAAVVGLFSSLPGAP